jgi:vacuolar-type H+-ATPase subunit H
MTAPASTLTPRRAVRGRAQKFAQAGAAALEPLKTELLRRAHAAAAERVEEAVAEDAATIAAAERQATQIVEQARQEGLAEASEWLAAQRARSRRQARMIILRARAEAFEELRRQSGAAVARLATEPDYPELHDRLVDYVQAQLGEQAVITDAATGGVIGTVPGLRLDCSFGTLVEQVLAERAAQPDMPWTT